MPIAAFKPPGVGAAAARAITSIEYVTVAFANADTTKSVDLTKGQNQAQCVPFVSARIAATLASFTQVDVAEIGVTIEVYDNAGTAAIRVVRATANKAFTCHIYVVAFGTGVTVVRGSTTLTTDGTVAISAVNLAKSFLVHNSRGAGISRAPHDGFIRGRFNSATQLGFNRNNDVATPGGTATIWYYIVKDTLGTLFDVQTAEASMGAGVTTVNTAITSVDMTKTMLVSSCDGAFNIAGLNSEGYSYLQSATNVRTVRTNSTSNTDLHTSFAVTFLDGTSVQRGIRVTNTGIAADSDRSETVAITTVDTTKSIARWTMINRANRGGRNTIWNGSNNHSIEITAGGASITIRYRGYATASEVEAAWEVITFNI